MPRLTDGQVIVGLARIVALLRDDETQLLLPAAAVYPFNLQWVGTGLYFIAAPAADRRLLGARLLAIDGHPVGDVLSSVDAEIDAEDPGLVRDLDIGADEISAQDPGYLNDADLLYWLGLTGSAARALFTVRTASGQWSVWLSSVGSAGGQRQVPPIAYVPLPLYLRQQQLPYWLDVLAAHNAVYLKYNRCLNDAGFQRLAARALALLRAHPSYRLIVDLRNNGGGDSEPFLALVTGIRADPAVNRRGRVFGLVNDLTDSSASVDAYNLRSQTHALLIGQPAADPIDEFGNDNGMLLLPHYGVVVQYTTSVVNPAKTRYGIPDIVVAPTVRDWPTGIDPVLAVALSYGRQ